MTHSPLDEPRLHALGHRVKLGVISDDHRVLHSMSRWNGMVRLGQDHQLDGLFRPHHFFPELDLQQAALVTMSVSRYR